jgi:putative ABC transport system permease protein
MNTLDIVPWRLLLGYSLLIFPLAICLWFRIPLLKRIGTAVLRMTVQLLLVGFYLQVLFERNNPWLNLLWLGVMLTAADLSILRGSNLHLRRFGGPLFAGLLIGIAVPVLVFLGCILGLSEMSQAQYLIPIAGMVLGNCLRANIVGLSRFYHDLRRQERAYCLSLTQGATQSEALRPYFQGAFQAALGPTTATMATAGLVALPGMMTGAMLGGVDPAVAIKYQIAIMLSIFSGTAITIWVTLWLTAHTSFDGYGLLDKHIFKDV